MAYDMDELQIEKFHEDQYPPEWLVEDWKRKNWGTSSND